jgi:hypothetical protein
MGLKAPVGETVRAAGRCARIAAEEREGKRVSLVGSHARRDGGMQPTAAREIVPF